MQFSSFLWKDVKDRRKRRESFCSLLTIIITELKFNSKWSLTFRWRTTQPWAASFTIHCCWRNTFWKFANWWVMGIQMLKTSTKVWQKVPNWSGEAIADHPMVGFAFTSHTSGHDFLSSLCTITKKNKKFKKNILETKRKKDFLLIASVDFHPVWRLCWSQLSPLVSFSEWERQTWQIVFLLKRNPNPHTGYILF